MRRLNTQFTASASHYPHNTRRMWRLIAADHAAQVKADLGGGSQLHQFSERAVVRPPLSAIQLAEDRGIDPLMQEGNDVIKTLFPK